MAFGDSPDDAALRAAWAEFCERLRAAGDQVFKDHNPGDAAPARRRVPLPDPESRTGLRSGARDQGYALSGAACLLHAASQARRRRRRFHVPAGLDRRPVRLPDHRQYRHRALPELHRSRTAPGETTGHRLAEPARALRRHSGSQSLQASDRSRAGWQLRAVSSAARGAGRTGCRPRRARASSSSARASIAGTRLPARLCIERVGMDRAAAAADARDDPHGDGWAGDS